MSWHARSADGMLVLRIHVQPGARRTEVAGLHGEALKVRVAAAAVEDRANEALVAFIAERLGVARRDVSIASGARSREKRVEVRGPADPALLYP
jgi:uncharacterized protein (TIGR00251 family)